MTVNTEFIFAKLFHSLFSSDVKLNIAQSVITYFYIMSIYIDVYDVTLDNPSFYAVHWIWLFRHKTFFHFKFLLVKTDPITHSVMHNFIGTWNSPYGPWRIESLVIRMKWVAQEEVEF